MRVASDKFLPATTTTPSPPPHTSPVLAVSWATFGCGEPLTEVSEEGRRRSICRKKGKVLMESSEEEGEGDDS